MKNFLLRGTAVFFLLVLASAVMVDVFKTEFGTIDFFTKRGWFFLIAITVFPRLTLLFSSVMSGGFLWWVAWAFCPRILVATLATVAYFHTNPLLVVISWLVALGGETMEKAGISRQRFVFRTYPGGGRQKTGPHEAGPIIGDGETIEAEFKVKD